MDLQDAICRALDGRAILFTGAGFSFGATNINGKRLPSGKSLANDLLTEIGYTQNDGTLDKAAAAYLRRKSRRELVQLLIDRFSIGNVSASHETVASIPWRRIYTTNYDTVYEEASRRIKKVCSSIDGVDHPRDHLFKPNLLVHINGAINRLTEDRLENSFKLISQSYAADSFENSGWAFHFRNDIRTASAIVFLGYSMYDLDVRRVLFSEDISNKCAFVVAPLTAENALDAEDLSDLGIVAPIGVDLFAKLIEQVRSSYTPQATELLLQEWEEPVLITSAPKLPTDAEVLDFLTKGDASDALLLAASGPDRNKYVVERTSLPRIDADLAKKDARVLVIGDLGTGKSFVYDCISQAFLARNWNVFKLDGGSDDEISEAEAICEAPGEKLLIVENYQRHMDLLRWISEANPPDTSLAITARTNTHELFASELLAMFGDQLRIHDVSKLTKPEQLSAVSIFDQYGFWGDRIKWGPERKQQFLIHDCGGYLPSVLVDVLKSHHITERYNKLLSESGNRSDVEELLICAFALEVMGFAPKLSHIQELLANRVRWGRLRTQIELKTVIDFDANAVRAKSSVLATHLLRFIFSAKTIVSTLIGMAKEADTRRRERDFYQIGTALMRYRSVSALLPEANRLESTINFYEGVKNLSITKRNPQFWLQYAIACLAFGKLERSETYFKDAYSLASNGYDTYQIDNHYARLLIEKALIAPSINDAFLFVEDARRILLQQMGKEVRYYPYRVALGLFKCYERFLTAWKVDQKAYFMRIFEEIRRRCESLTGDVRNNNYVVECLARAKQTLEQQ